MRALLLQSEEDDGEGNDTMKKTAALILIICMVLALYGAGFRWLAVTSGSMEPAFGPGAAILIRPCDVSRLKEGDIVTCSIGSGDRKVTHRLIRIEEDTGRIVTRGDANTQEDAPADPDTVLGKVCLAVPKAGYAVLFMESMYGKITFCGSCLLLLLFSTVLSARNPVSDRTHPAHKAHACREADS